MCGIGAIYGENVHNGKSTIKKSLEVIKHRGYSHYEMNVFDKCVLGCNRLEIVDRQKAIQPQSNEDDSISVVFNGEIFNYRELIDELAGKGHTFRTNSLKKARKTRFCFCDFPVFFGPPESLDFRKTFPNFLLNELIFSLRNRQWMINS